MKLPDLFKGCLPNLIAPIPISPNFSSHFALYRLAAYPFCPLPFLPHCHLAQSSFCPLTFANSPFADLPNATSPLYHFAHSPLRPMPFCLFIVSPFYNHFITLFQFHFYIDIFWLTGSFNSIITKISLIPKTLF